MAKLSSENTDTFRYFRAYLEHWMNEEGINKTIAAKRLGAGQSQFNEILNGKRGASICQMENFVKRTGLDLVEALEQGKHIYKKEQNTDPLTQSQQKAVKLLYNCLLEGGERANILIEIIFALLNKKNATKKAVKTHNNELV